MNAESERDRKGPVFGVQYFELDCLRTYLQCSFKGSSLSPLPAHISLLHLRLAGRTANIWLL